MKREADIIIDDSDSEDEDAALQLAMRLSAEEHTRAVAKPGSSNREEASTSMAAASSSLNTTGESRADMEKARLERLRQREMAGDIGSSRAAAKVGPAVKRPRVATLADLNEDAEEARAGESSMPDKLIKTNGNMHSFGPSAPPARKRFDSGQRFWNGAVKRVYNQNVLDDDSLTFQDLVAKTEGLEMAIVGAFVLEPEWVARHFDPETPLLLVMSRGKTEQDLTNEEVVNPGVLDPSIKPNTFRVVPDVFRTNGYSGSMHTKIVVLYYKDFLRIAIPTANAISYDWAIVDNALFVQDFPLLPSRITVPPDPRDNPTHTQFSRRFLEVLHSLNVPKLFVSLYKKWDFSKSAEVRLVASRQGTWKGWEEMRRGGGVVALASAVKSFEFGSSGKWEVECQGSSIGTYQTNWLVQFFAACEGVKPRSYFTQKQRTPAHLPQVRGPAPVKLRMKIVFPTMAEIRNTFGGYAHGGTIFCQEKQWNTSGFPCHLFHKGISKRSRVAAHTKTIVALKKLSASSPVKDQKHEGWVYVGSHNFTPAAWGRLEWSSSGSPQLVCRNYELGVVVPIRAKSDQDLENQASALATYVRPLVPYGKGDKPWMQDTPE